MTSGNCVLSFEQSSLSFHILLLCHICKINALVVSYFPLYSNWISQYQWKTFDYLLACGFDTSFPGSLLAWVCCPCSGKALVTGDEELCLRLFPCHQLVGGVLFVIQIIKNQNQYPPKFAAATDAEPLCSCVCFLLISSKTALLEPRAGHAASVLQATCFPPSLLLAVLRHSQQGGVFPPSFAVVTATASVWNVLLGALALSFAGSQQTLEAVPVPSSLWACFPNVYVWVSLPKARFSHPELL